MSARLRRWETGRTPESPAWGALTPRHAGRLRSPAGGPSITRKQPLINFCNKYSTSLLTFEIACRVYIISLQLQASRQSPRAAVAARQRASSGTALPHAREAVQVHGRTLPARRCGCPGSAASALAGAVLTHHVRCNSAQHTEPRAAPVGSPLPSSQQLGGPGGAGGARRGAGSGRHGHTDAVTGLLRPGAPRPPLPARAGLRDRGRVVPGVPANSRSHPGNRLVLHVLRRYSEVSQGERAAPSTEEEKTPQIKGSAS